MYKVIVYFDNVNWHNDILFVIGIMIFSEKVRKGIIVSLIIVFVGTANSLKWVAFAPRL